VIVTDAPTAAEVGDRLVMVGVVPVAQSGKLKLPIAVLQLNAPVAFSYSWVNQNVQSSVGSMVREL
jgi:hypothetical protein